MMMARKPNPVPASATLMTRPDFVPGTTSPMPNVKNVVPLDEIGRIKIDARNQKTEVAGIWAAGDCTDVLYHQNNIAAGDAVRALEDIYLAIHTK